MATLAEAVVTTHGLCSACKHEEGCIYPRNKDEIVLNCGQFEPSPSMPSPPLSKDHAELEKLWQKPSTEKGSSKFVGLCASCADRDVCIYPKPLGGVWLCEEYR